MIFDDGIATGNDTRIPDSGPEHLIEAQSPINGRNDLDCADARLRDCASSLLRRSN